MTTNHWLEQYKFRSVLVLAINYPDGHEIDWHSHHFSQLVYACSGVMTVRAESNQWVIPPQRAVWIPAGVSHQVAMHGQSDMRSLYIRPEVFDHLPEQSGVLNVSPLLRELILHLASLPQRDVADQEERRVIGVAIDQLKNANSAGFYLPEASDKRLKQVCQAIQANPCNDQTLTAWALQANVSSRTLSRLFRQELGVSLVEYRQQVRMLAALIKLAKGEPVTRVSMSVGFSSLSAFHRLFRKNFSTTPGAFFD